MRKCAMLFACSALLLTRAGAQKPPPVLPVPPELRQPKVSIAWNRLYDYPDVVAILRRLHEAYPRITRLESIGKSVEGRDMWLLTICNPATGSDDRKPAMWADGNTHGNEVQGAEATLYLAWYLLENYGHVPAITKLVDRVAFYVLPMVNPDGRAWWFEHANTASSSRSGKRPFDNDGDGLLDEDGYDDLDGDGEITLMRKRDPFGDWKTSPDDPRLMVRVKPGELGEWTLLGREGIDNDGDGRVNEDGPGGYDMNRNWPADWQPGYVQYGAGEYPFSFPETASIGRFVIDHPNIAAVQSFHNAGGMILRGPGVESTGRYPREDVAVYDLIGHTGEEMLPFYRYMVIWKDLYPVYGGFVNWTYEGLGIFSFTNEMWVDTRMTPQARKGPDQDERMRLNDLLRSGIDFVPWKEFDHPTYGKIEIGGWRSTTGRTPPSFLIEEESHRNALFCIFHANQIPEIAFASVEKSALAPGRTKIDVVIANAHVIPTVSARSREKRIGLPDLLIAQGAGVHIAFAAIVERRFPERLRPIEKQPERIANWRGSAQKDPFRIRYIVEGAGTLDLTYRSQKGGTIHTTVAIP